MVTTLVPAEASRLARRSQDSRLVGRLPQAVEFGVMATKADASRAAYWSVLGLAYIAAARLGDASVAFERAMMLAPYDVRHIGDLARAQLLLADSGDAAARSRALQLGDQAVRTDPNNPRAHLTRALVRQVTGDLPQALLAVERALALDPQSTNDQLYVTATQVMVASGRAADAIGIARHGLAILGQARRSVPLRLEVARALVATGKPADALTELELALVISPNDAAVERLRVEIGASLGR